MTRDDQKRREVVAALRELADLLESSPWLPVPFSGRLQALIPDSWHMTQAERFAGVREAATHLGVDVVEWASGSRVASRWVGPVEYFVLANPDEPGGRRERVVPAGEDAALVVRSRTAVAAR
jgi:hypothetical protein